MESKHVIIRKELTDEERKENLKHLYDVINKLGNKLYKNGKDVSELFYTKEEYQEILNSGKNLI